MRGSNPKTMLRQAAALFTILALTLASRSALAAGDIDPARLEGGEFGATKLVHPRPRPESDLYRDWKAHGIQAIRECRETRPSDYLKIVAMIVSKAEDLSGLADGMHDAAFEEIIEERRQQALAMIAKMR